MNTRIENRSILTSHPRLARRGMLLAVVLLAGCTGGGHEATQQSLIEALAEVQVLQKQVAELTRQQGELERKLGSLAQQPAAPAAAASTAGFPPELLPKETLEKSLLQTATDSSREIKSALAAKGLEVTSFGIPRVIMPEAFTTPYVAEVDLNVTKGGRAAVVPLTFRADWEGKWQVPPTEELLAAVETGLQPAAAQAQPSARNVGGGVAQRPQGVGPAPSTAPTASPATPAPQPVRQAGPNIPGVESRDIDLRGKDIFGPGSR